MTAVSVHIADVGLPKSLGLIRHPRPASIPGLLQANAGIGAKFGTTPARLRSPTVGLIPTMPFAPEGQTIEPSVSEPMAATARSAAVPAPEPELEPQGLRSRT